MKHCNHVAASTDRPIMGCPARFPHWQVTSIHGVGRLRCSPICDFEWQLRVADFRAVKVACGSIRARRVKEDRSFAVRGSALAARWSAVPHIADPHGGTGCQAGCRLLGAYREYVPPSANGCNRCLADGRTWKGGDFNKSVALKSNAAVQCSVSRPKLSTHRPTVHQRLDGFAGRRTLTWLDPLCAVMRSRCDCLSAWNHCSSR